jgi:threonine/homoserine/homoserine lactone efflux protein
MVFFTLALSLCVLGLVAISLWWSWLFIAAILESLRSDRKLKRPEREPRSREITDLPPPEKGHST